MQVTIARQLGLEPTTVGNFFMNARRRSMDKWRDDNSNHTQTTLVTGHTPKSEMLSLQDDVVSSEQEFDSDDEM